MSVNNDFMGRLKEGCDIIRKNTVASGQGRKANASEGEGGGIELPKVGFVWLRYKGEKKNGAGKKIARC